MPVKIFAPARARLLEIWDYTEKTWGADQADTYLRGLAVAIDKAQHTRRLWRSVKDETLAGVYYFRYRHHLVFFRELSQGTLGIITVLHESMDLPERLREDFEENSPE